jgi:glycosyltransferase involved in cell wall biosynthesis
MSATDTVVGVCDSAPAPPDDRVPRPPLRDDSRSMDLLETNVAVAPVPARRVLLVALDFPPRRTSGVYRPTRFVKYLPRHGWQPTVLTIRPQAGDIEDASLLRRLGEHTRIARTAYPNLRMWEDRAFQFLGGLGGTPNGATPAAGASPVASANQESTGRARGSLLRRTYRWLRHYVYLPDEAISWVPFAAAEVVRLHMERPFDVIYTTSPPRAIPLIGLLAKRLLGARWVCEFRDPWLLAPEARQLILEEDPPWLRRQVEQRLERAILREADALVTVTEGYAQELIRERGARPEKLQVISNGFDEEDFAPRVEGQEGFFDRRQIHLCHFGSVYPRFSGGFFAGLRLLLRNSPEWRGRLRVHIIGFPDREVAAEAAHPELAGVVETRGFLPHADALRAMDSSDGLLLFYADRYIAQACIPGKIYEFLRVGRPVLAVTYEGGLQKLVDGSGAGRVLPPHDAAGIERGLRMFLERAARGVRERVLPGFEEQFRYDRLTGNLAQFLNQVADDGR